MPAELLFKAMADQIRQRLLRVLSRHELSVGELVEVLDLPQSTISRHLKVLRAADLLVDRRAGATVLYAAAPGTADPLPAMEPDGSGISTVMEPEHQARAVGHGRAQRDLPATPDRDRGTENVSTSPKRKRGVGGVKTTETSALRHQLLAWARHENLDPATDDRLQHVLQRRRHGNEFFENVGARWDQLRIEAFGESFQLEALTALLPSEWTVADIGTGTGYLLPLLAARFRRVIAVDPVAAMLDAARSLPELRGVTNVEFRAGSMEHLPAADGELDLAIGSLVLHHVADPPAALRELRRCIRPGGRLLLIEQAAHEHQAFHDRMGDHWWGFEPETLAGWTREAGLTDIRTMPLASVRPSGRNAGQVPALFALTASVP